MAEFISQQINKAIGGLLAPLKGPTVAGLNTLEYLKGNYIWTPDQVPWGGRGDAATTDSVTAEFYEQKFYSGQDTFVFLVKKSGQLIALPITGIGYGVSQQKVPVFGAWSYTWDAMLRGTRIVQGQLSLIFSQPNLLMQLLGEEDPVSQTPATSIASRSEVQRRADLKSALWNDKGDANKPLYDASSVSGGHVSALPFGRTAPAGKAPADYAGHPPFDLLIVHGNDPNKAHLSNQEWNNDAWSNTTGEQFKTLSSDHNDKSGSNFAVSERIYIENVELMSSGIQYDMSGQPLQEAYSFVARDVTTPLPNVTPKLNNDKPVFPGVPIPALAAYQAFPFAASAPLALQKLLGQQ